MHIFCCGGRLPKMNIYFNSSRQEKEEKYLTFHNLDSTTKILPSSPHFRRNKRFSTISHDMVISNVSFRDDNGAFRNDSADFRSSSEDFRNKNGVEKTPKTNRCFEDDRLSCKSFTRYEENRPLLEASSLSSFNSELTEESLLDSSFSDECHSLERNKLKSGEHDFRSQLSNRYRRKRGKLRNLKHRSHSSLSMIERSLTSIPEGCQRPDLKQPIENSAKLIIDTATNDLTIDTNKQLRIDIAVPRRKSKRLIKNSSQQNIQKQLDASAAENAIFSKEQKRRLKKKMSDTKKCPQNSVFLGLL